MIKKENDVKEMVASIIKPLVDKVALLENEISDLKRKVAQNIVAIGKVEEEIAKR